MPPQPQISESAFGPCASTASLFLHSQGSVILCLHHDTLALERKFEHHLEDINFISVDNVSERGAGRLVVSYDVGQTAIVWDLFTGNVIARFASFEQLRVAAWMRNGNVAFGNEKGDVILFEPSTSENISCRTIFDPITALAPGSDCRTYAIGYQNGSILIATLHPTFTIVHTMTTSRGPSPIVSLAWHASSSKQKSDMLATLAANGDLRVWSVAKPPGKEVPRTIRVLKRSDTSSPSAPKWMSWSKNGRIVQYLDGETWSWDVRTKHVTSEPIPTVDNPRGFASYGPTATLFTLGPQYTVQQYDLENPAMVANVQHLPAGVVIPVPIEEARARAISPRTLQDPSDMRESNQLFGTRRAPFDSSGIDVVGQQCADLTSPASSRSHANSRQRNPTAVWSVLCICVVGVDVVSQKFPAHRPLDESHLTPDDLRRQMLSVVFGWDGDIIGLLNNELSHHPPGSQSAILLAQWLGESDTDQMVSMLASGPASSADWMLLAFSQMRGESQANKVGQAFVQKLLEIGDIHTSATILLGLGDKNDAIEVYVSQNYYMEAILMTCLVMPTDWQRQSFLVRRWGEHVVSHSQQQLAIRCFMCTGVEPSDPWTSPAAQQATSLAEVISRRSPITSPEPYQNPVNLLPPSTQPKGPANVRHQSKTPALKLITSFDSQPSQKFRFPGLKSDDRTPTNAPGVTPIAESAVVESAVSPGGFGSYKLNNIQSINNAVNPRTGTPGYSRRRLPSIGETPVDVHPPTFPSNSLNKPAEYSSTSENDGAESNQVRTNKKEKQPSLLPSARYDPDENYKPSPQTAVQASSDKFAGIKGLPSPAAGFFDALKERSDSRNGSRDRMPDGLQLHLQHDESFEDDPQDELDMTIGNFRSPTSTLNSYSSAKSPSVSGRSIDQYISSLDEANYHAKKYQSHRSHGQSSARRHHSRNPSQETRGRRENRYVAPAKRSPSSPVPMSPEEVASYHNFERHEDGHRNKNAPKTRSTSRVRKPRSRASSERRNNRSSSRHTASRLGGDKNETSNRGRSIDRPASRPRSPSSPLPMSATDDALRLVTSDRERRTQQRSGSRRPEKGAGASSDSSPEANRTRARSRSRHGHESRPNTVHDQNESMANGNGKDAVVDAKSREITSELTDQARDIHTVTMPLAGLSEQRRKDLAAAELEARRLSLARNPSAPNIPFPGELQPSRSALESPPFSVNSFGPRAPGRRKMSASKASPEYPSSSDSNSSRSGGPHGLPSTPKAMRHPKYAGCEETASSIPPVPDSATILGDPSFYMDDSDRIGRSMSVPVPENQQKGTVPTDLPTHPRFNPNLPRSRSTSRGRNTGHHRESSRETSGYGGYSYGGSPVSISIEETIENVMKTKQVENPPILPELQHLNTPPPPPPLPASPRESSGTIDIAIDNDNMGKLLPRAMTAAPAPTMDEYPAMERRRMSFDHRRGRSVNESFTSKIRNLTRMGSRGPDAWAPAGEMHLPYESVQMAESRM
ncbi:uncharacterized protein ATNIH1004_001731 [Aspergillus tanneri]|uniref:Gem-associated protein 5 TPR domain-containing protein n=1 Tax=Aspergillus tanneri TaxID=1220188 RepID=A0A5M9N0H2_9EURO|nr:uncharacterized protein ATNIH1004_001731 [Aspergillus tanneri]KAA8652822.1 hypothetical protein ATNIH1004_001731 [Aspergillus tanneri]